MKTVCSVGLFALLIWACCSHVNSLKGPTETKKRGQKSSSLMVDIAEEVENVDSSVPSSQEIEESAKAQRAETSAKEAKDLRKANEDANLKAASAVLCHGPSYLRDYSQVCPEGFSAPAWAEGACYEENAPPGSGSALVDFRPMSEADKQAWEKQFCKFFPPLVKTKPFAAELVKPAIPLQPLFNAPVIRRGKITLPIPTYRRLGVQGPVDTSGEIIVQ